MPTLFVDDSSSAEVLLKGNRTQGVTEVSWEESRDPGKPKGIGKAKRLGETRGSYDSSGSFKMLLRRWEEFRATLPQNGFGEEPFTIVVNVEEDDQPMLTWEFRECRITSPKVTITGDSTDALMAEVDISIDQVIHPGGGTLVRVPT